MDFMIDRLADKRSYRLLNLVDIFSRECVAMEVAQSFRSEDAVRVLKNACREHGLPKAIRCDNGTEFVAMSVDRWAYGKRLLRAVLTTSGRCADPASALCRKYGRLGVVADLHGFRRLQIPGQ